MNKRLFSLTAADVMSRELVLVPQEMSLQGAARLLSRARVSGAPVVDQDGVVYANSEDGNLYAISQGGALKQNIFLDLALGAAYTPLAIGADGKVYTENKGTLFVIGQ